MSYKESDNPLDFNAKTDRATVEATLELSDYDKARLAKHEAAGEARRKANAKNGNAEALKPYQFKKGQGGNTGGVRTAWTYYEKRVRNLTPEILDRLVQILKEGKDKDALKAAEILLERAWGKAIEQVNVTGVGTQIPIINISIGGSTETVRTIDCNPQPKVVRIEHAETKTLPSGNTGTAGTPALITNPVTTPTDTSD